jgi:hypothetical protein
VNCTPCGPLKFSFAEISEVLRSIHEILANPALDRVREAPVVINFIQVEKIVVDQSQSPSVSVRGNVGMITTGGTVTIESVNQTIGALIDKSETKSVGAALKALSDAIKMESSVDNDKKTALLEHLDEISTKASQPKDSIKRSVLKSTIDTFAGLCSGAGGVAAVWQTWGPAIRVFFGI